MSETRAKEDQPWEPKVEPPIDIKNEVRMADLNGMMIEEEK